MTTSAKTVFVLGAGASCEAGLPTGEKLRDVLASLLDISFDWKRQQTGDRVIGTALREHVEATKTTDQGVRYLEAALGIRNGMKFAVSIDNYLHQHRGNKEAELCGKLAIVRAILTAERNSRMFLDPHVPAPEFPQSALQSTWYTPFWQMLTDGCDIGDLQKRFRSVAIIVFNYDRCIEHYLYYALQVCYGLPPSDAALLIQELEIHHPYGTVGALPWFQGDKLLAIPFGGEPSGHGLLKLAGLIRTFTESIDPNRSDIVAIRGTMQTASTLVILGFAFYGQNIELLWPELKSLVDNPGRCLATGYGISSADIEVIEYNLKQRTGMAMLRIRNDLLCHQLFAEYRHSIRIK